ncbi:ABC transporter substrate-binding protein [Cohnella xylanilytica]|uniref:ABC transporter substrate-binding protein n=1 Tax=Cohnella xylanilytica TaxID=557555 RepID=A0A841TSF4_9BACL|nr:ABC transporter substrate-binding protein [Cohnella xylanilytica]MBB6691357.1 ABC transporter substrate-binding protein [Cohnella xylanilytica]
MNKLYRHSLLALLILALFAVYGCSSGNNGGGGNGNAASGTSSPGTSSPAEPVSADLASELHFPLAQQVPTLDPHLALNTNVYVTMNIFEGLFAFDENFKPVPMLAESYDLSEDGKTYTFHLRHGVKFHNGKEMKAEDVVASLNRWKSLTGRAQASLGDSEFAVKDDYTVELALKEPRNDILAQLSHVLNNAAIMPKEVVEAAGPDGVKEYIGTGPFKFVEWKQDQYVHLSKFDDYQSVDAPPSGFSGKKEAFLQDVFFDIVPDSATRFASFLSGTYDYVDVSLDNLPQVQGLSDVTLNKNLGSDINLVFNKKSPLFSDVKYRQAVAAVLDADEILLGTVSSPELYRLNPSYMYPENTTWYSEAGKENYNQKNPDKAKQLLQEAGYDGREVTLLTTKELGGSFYNATIVVQKELESIGVKTKLDINDFATLLKKRADPNAWDIYVGLFTMPSTPSQLLYLNPTYGFADDAKLAELNKALTAASSDEEIKQANDALQQYEWEYLAAVKIGDTYSQTATRHKLTGLKTLAGYPNLANVKLSK